MTAVSFQPVTCVPREDYRDFLGCRFSPTEIHAGISAGIWPPGLIFQDADNKVWLVIGSYGNQRLEPWARILRIA